MGHTNKWVNARRSDPVTEVAAQSLQSRLESVQFYLPLAALKYEEDDEYLHQLRVWTRRADAAVEIYRELLPQWRAAWIQKQLKKIRKATNLARDDDVLARRLASEAATSDRLLKNLRKHRADVQHRVLDEYQRLTKKKGRLGRRIEKLLARIRLRGERRKLPTPTFRDWANEYLRSVFDSFMDAADGDLTDAASLHQFRVKGKSLRYAMELLSSAFSPRLRNEAYPLLEALQEQLGKVNDHAQAITRIRHWIVECGDSVQVKQMTDLLQCEQESFERERSRFSAWWTIQRRSDMRDTFDRALKGDAY